MRRNDKRTAPVVAGALVALVALAPPVRAGRAQELRVKAFELLNEGVSAYNRGEYPLAVEKLRASTEIALNAFRGYYYLGLALQGDRRYTESIESLVVALDLDPTHLPSLVAMGDAHLRLGDIEEAQAAFYRALRLRPGYAPALDGLARCYESRSQAEKAIETYRQALSSDMGFAPGYTHLGDLYLRLGRMAEAVRLLEEAVSVRPTYAPGLNRLALAYGKLGLNNEAVATIQRAIELEPGNADHAETLGRLELGQGRLQAARESFLRALDRDPARAGARLGLAEVARRRGDYTEAQAQVEAGLLDDRLDPDLERKLTALGAALAHARERVGELTAGVESGTASPAERVELALIYAGRGEWALAAEQQALGASTPDEREALAYFLFQAGRPREAYEVYSELGDAVDRRIPLNRGALLAALGDDAGAAEVFRRVLAESPDSVLAQLYLGNALLRGGDRPGAAAAYRRFLDAHGAGASAERVRRILKQIAPELVPPAPDDVLPPAPPPPPPEEENEGRS